MSVKFSFKSLGQPIEADWPVTVRVPTDGGGVAEQTFEVRFRSLTKEDQAELDALPEAEQPKAKLRKVVIGLGRSEETEFSPELLEDMMASSHVFMGLLGAYTGFVLGRPAKN